MAGASDIRAGGAYVELGTKDSKLLAGLNKSAKDIEKFGKAVRGIGLGVAGAGAAILTPLAAAGTAYAEHGESLAKGSKKTGVGVEALSTLSYAAQQTGTDGEALEKGFTKMSKTLAQAAEGSKSAQQALEDLGVSVADVQHLSQEDRFKLFADRIAKIQDPAQQAAAAMKIFGKGGAELLPLLQQGGQGIDALQARARALGLQMSTEDAKGAERFSRSLKDLWDVLQSGTYAVGSAVAPVLEGIAQAITTAVIAVRGWILEHKQLFAIAAAVAAGLVALGAAIVGIGTVISIVGGALAGIGSALGIVVAVVGAIVSPIGLVIAGIAGMAAAFLYFTDVGQAVGASIMGVFKDIFTAIQFVQNSSSLSEAWGVAMTEAGLFIMQGWAQVKGFLVGLWISVKGVAIDTWDSIGSAIVNAAYGASDAFLRVWAKTMHAWNSLVNATAETIQDTFLATANSQRDADIAQVKAQYEAPGSKMTPQEATKAIEAINKTYDGYDDKQRAGRDKGNDDQLDKKLADIKAEADTRQKYLDDLRAKQQAANAQQTADEKTANAKELADATATAKAARAAYEAEQKKKHEKDGGGSLLDGLKGSFESLIDPALLKKIQDLKDSGATDADGGLAAKKTTSALGTFDKSTLFGFGNAGGPVLDRIAKAAEANTKATESVAKGIEDLSAVGPLTYA